MRRFRRLDNNMTSVTPAPSQIAPCNASSICYSRAAGKRAAHQTNLLGLLLPALDLPAATPPHEQEKQAARRQPNQALYQCGAHRNYPPLFL